MTHLRRLIPLCLGFALAWLPVSLQAQSFDGAEGEHAYLEALRAQVASLDSLLDLGTPPAPAPCGTGPAPVTRGLLVAASQWTGDRANDLAGPENDTAFLRNALVARGADAAHLTVLTGAEATRAGLERAAAGLLAATQCGDSVFLHLSGWLHPATFFAPVDAGIGPFADLSDLPSLADLGGIALGERPVNRVIADGPWALLNARAPGTADVLSAAALSDWVTQIRNRGADVTVVLDTSTAEDMRLEDRQARVDPRGLWRTRVVPPGVDGRSPELLNAQAGALTVYYGTASGEITLEMKLPEGARDARYFGVFSFGFAQALLRADRTTPAAVARRITVDEAAGGPPRDWTYVFSTTDPDRDLIVEERPPATTGGGTIRILSPEPSRAAAPLESAALMLRGQVEAPAETLIVTVNGQIARSTPDGVFEMGVELQAGVNRIDVLAMTRDNQPITHSFELFYEGDMQALLGNGARYAVLIANQDYPDGSGLSDLQTPIADAKALAEILTGRYGFQTTATLPDGQTVDLVLRDATRLQIETLLYQIGQIAGEKDSVLIFYAGHGLYEAATDGAFWLPADARMGLPFSYLPASAITDALLRIEAGSVLVISDSCYSGALLRGDDQAEAVDADDRLRALQRLAAKRSRIVIASGGNEPVLDGGGDGHSVFARALLSGLEEMEEDAFTARELFDRYLLPMVVGRAAQEPQYRPIERSGHEGGDVVLSRLSPAAP